MTRLDSLRQDLVGVCRFGPEPQGRGARGSHSTPLPLARVVAVPGRGEIFVRQADGPAGADTVVLLHGWALTADLNWFSGMYDTAAAHGPVLAPVLR